MKYWILGTALLAILRVVVALQFEPESASLVGSYQAFAHLFFGGLAVSEYHKHNSIKVTLLGTLLMIEVACAVLSRIL